MDLNSGGFPSKAFCVKSRRNCFELRQYPKKFPDSAILADLSSGPSNTGAQENAAQDIGRPVNIEVQSGKGNRRRQDAGRNPQTAPGGPQRKDGSKGRGGMA